MSTETFGHTTSKLHWVKNLYRAFLDRHELGEHQHLEIRVAFLGLEAVDPVQERFGLGVRALGFAASCRFQEQLHLGPFILQSLEPGLEQRVHLLLAVQVGPVLLGDHGEECELFLWGLERFKTALQRRLDCAGAGDHRALHQDHEESDVAALLSDSLVVALAHVFGDRLV